MATRAFKAGIIAAGLGERFRQAGIATPKALIQVGGRSLLERAITTAVEAGASSLAVIVNREAAELEAYLRERSWPVPLVLTVRTTPSSMESLFALAPELAGDPFLLLTVDAVFARGVAAALVAEGLAGGSDGVLGVTDLVHDERPLRVHFTEDRRIMAIGPNAAASRWITSGVYFFSPRVFAAMDEARERSLGRLREFLGLLVERGLDLRAHDTGTSIDVDDPSDVELAEKFLAEEARVAPAHPPASPSASPHGDRRIFTSPRGGEVGRRPGEGEIIAISRERRFSPGKVEDDAAILQSTATRLRDSGASVRIIDADRRLPDDLDPALVVAMCQSGEALAWLDRFATRVPVVNAPAAIRACHRVTLAERLGDAGVPHPRWRLAGERYPDDLGPEPWLKRGDVHAMEPGDVRRVRDEHDYREARAELARRSVASAIVQAHVEGPVYKFYGVAGGFFRAFGLPETHLAGAERAAAAAARALGLEVYGGDGVCGDDGSVTLIDDKDWPSFSRCRDDAAEAIARRLLAIWKGAHVGTAGTEVA